MNINWKVRIQNKMFWLAMIPAVLVLVHNVLIMFGIDFEYTVISEQLKNVVESVFLCLTLLGIVVDPTTKGVSDSKQALGYTEPKSE